MILKFAHKPWLLSSLSIHT